MAEIDVELMESSVRLAVFARPGNRFRHSIFQVATKIAIANPDRRLQAKIPAAMDILEAYLQRNIEGAAEKLRDEPEKLSA
jgi:hypothetical protein